MAKLTQPLMSESASGRVGAVIYAPWRGTATARQWTAGLSEHTPLELRRLGLLIRAGHEWGAMPAFLRPQWRDFQKKYPRIKGRPVSAWNWFLKLMVKKLLADFLPTLPPPTYFGGAPIQLLRANYSDGILSIAWEFGIGTDPGDSRVLIYITKGHSPGRTPSIKEALFHSSFANNDVALIPIQPRIATYTIFAQTVWPNGTETPFIKTSIDVRP